MKFLAIFLKFFLMALSTTKNASNTKKNANKNKPRSMLILRELDHMIRDVGQLYVWYLVVAEILQQLTASRCIL